MGSTSHGHTVNVQAAPLQYILDLVNGLVPGKSTDSMFGQNDDIDTGPEQTLWDGGGNYTTHFLTSPADIFISSDNAGDVGQPHIVLGLQEETNGDWTSTTRLAVTNGTTEVAVLSEAAGGTGVSTITEMIRVHKILNVGPSINTGTIYFAAAGTWSAGVPVTFTDIKSQILPGNGTTRNGFVTAPSNKFFSIPLSRGFLGKNKDVTYRPQVRLFGGVFTRPGDIQSFQSEVINLLGVPFGIPPKTDIMVNVTTENDNTPCQFGFEYILEDIPA